MTANKCEVVVIKGVIMGTIKLKKTSANQSTQHIIYFAHLFQMMMQTLHCVIFLSSFSVLEFSKIVYHYLPSDMGKGVEAN